jgi:hypothetical protein
VAQPTETERRFEVSERSSALPVPALSRYARPDAKPHDARPPTGHEDAETSTPAQSDTAEARKTEDVALEAAPDRIEDLLGGDSRRDSEPIVQAANEEWATDPSPPQPVSDARRTDPVRSAAAREERRDLPALRESAAQPPRADEKRPFWKRLSMSRSAAPAPPPVAQVPPDLLKPALERIDHLTRRFEHEQKALHERLDQFEHNITRLWELEEQMGLEEIRAQLAVIQANQEEIADGVHAIARNVAVAAGLGLALLAGVLLWVVL